MEIHPPEHGIHNWREFFVHMGTIVLGVLIAIGLEQSVEAIHRRHELNHLRRELRADIEKNKRRTDGLIRYELVENQWYQGAWKVMRENIDHPGANVSISPFPYLPADAVEPGDAVWTAARQSGTATLMSGEEFQIYSELGIGYDDEKRWAQLHEQGEAATLQLLFELKNKDGSLDLASRTLEERRRIAHSMNEAYYENGTYCGVLEELDRADEAILNGAKDVDEVTQAETANTKPWEQPVGH